MECNFFQKLVRIICIYVGDINLPSKQCCATLNIFYIVDSGKYVGNNTHKMHCFHFKIGTLKRHIITLHYLSFWNVTLFGISEINYVEVQDTAPKCSVFRLEEPTIISWKWSSTFLWRVSKYLPHHRITSPNRVNSASKAWKFQVS
jgi:hypothetical protein